MARTTKRYAFRGRWRRPLGVIEKLPSSEELEHLRPVALHRIYDLVAAAGVSVKDWGNYKGGPSKASQNPKYCYEWAFEEPNRLVVLCLWFDNLKASDNVIYQEPNPRSYAESIQDKKPKPGTVIGRARRMDRLIENAYNRRLPIKVIVCDGHRRDREDPNSKPSSVTGRMLDPAPWAVTAYDPLTGNCVVTRGALAIEAIDQYSTLGEPARSEVRSAQPFIRDRSLRDAALRRSCGRCEYCGTAGFETDGGYIYLETHHIVPLSEGGADHERSSVSERSSCRQGIRIYETPSDVLSRYYETMKADT